MKKNIVVSLVGTALVAAGMIVENKFGIVGKATNWIKDKIDQAKSKAEEEELVEQPAETEK